ncbi:MAG: hypothetical protein ACSHW1_17940 [Yoonia sp.]|uniref:hypothetical protein n=1 Tax=Yoonia sp. TaxID=2212373 RepID=UPI003EF3E338
MSESSEYGAAKFKDGELVGWFRFSDDVKDMDAEIAEARIEGLDLVVSEISDDFAPLKRDESQIFRDMTYEECRRRYTESRERILASIRAGGVSASMSGIEYYPVDWDDCEPSQFEMYLKSAMTWNGLFHFNIDWFAVLNANHPNGGHNQEG